MNPYPKPLQLLLKEIYKEFPHMRRHPEYRFYYIHYSYPKNKEYFIVLTNLIPDSYEDDDVVSYINQMGSVFGFIEATLMKPDDFEKFIMKPITESINELRGSEFKTFGYEVW
jgi:hypothetical protein